MASLAGLQSLTLTYLGTTATDPAYPGATLTALLNAVGNRYVDDVHQAKPDYLNKIVTLAPVSSTSTSYTLPVDFAGWLEVRADDETGSLLTEVRAEELNVWGADAPAFAVVGADGSAVLKSTVGLGRSIYLCYRYTPDELSLAGDTPAWMPTRFHDLLAREAAIDGFGLGNESAPASHFLATTEDRRAQFWTAISRRGVAPTIQR